MAADPREMQTIDDVVRNGMCIGCGLCSSVSNGRVTMEMTPAGGLRPSSTDFTEAEEAVLLAACPGHVVCPREEDGVPVDLVWGAHRSTMMAWAGDPEVRHRSATGGVLTALAQHLVREGRVAFVLHASADPSAPMRSTWTISESVDEVLASAGSRYGPVSVLAGLDTALDRGEPFAIVAKPCDLNAVHGLSAVDPRIDQLVTHRLAMVCGGTSRLTKSQAVLSEIGLDESEVGLFRYRGYGNPGPTRVESRDGAVYERSYLDMWADEGGWDLETRCKFCPDALGEAADVAAADAWPGGAPTGDDAGFNAVVVRTRSGAELVESASLAGELVIGDDLTTDDLNDFQPHQVRKKHALAARLRGVADAGLPVLSPRGLRVDALGEQLAAAEIERERSGAEERARAGRFAE